MSEKYSFEKSKTLEKEYKFFEDSALLDKALQKYLDYEDGKINSKELDDWINSEDGFAKQDRESFNCHTFLLSVMKNELGLENINTFEDVYIDTNKWKDDDGSMDAELWQAYQEHVSEEFPPDSDERMKKLKIFQDKVLNNSEEFTLNDLNKKLNSIREDIMKNYNNPGEQGSLSDNEYEKLCDEAREKYEKLFEEFEIIRNKKIKEFCNSIKDAFINNKLSRFVFIFDEDKNAQTSNRDVHSFIILGEDKKNEDLVIIEKAMSGESIKIKKLSDIIKIYLNQGVALNIPNKNIRELYS